MITSTPNVSAVHLTKDARGNYVVTTTGPVPLSAESLNSEYYGKHVAQGSIALLASLGADPVKCACVGCERF